jgi:disulfide bond formation protein DsbB
MMADYLRNKRLLNSGGFLVCMVLLGYALYAQYILQLEPCPLCIFQRVAVLAMAVVFLLAAVHNPGRSGTLIYSVLLAVAGFAGMAIAGRHVWLQNLPPEKVPACGPGLDFMLDAFPLFEVLEVVLTGSGECATIDWQFLGLSMPVWVLISITLLTVAGVSVNLLNMQRTELNIGQ